MIQTGRKYGMQLLDDAYAKANDKTRFRPMLKNPPSDFTDA
jgi:twitching motility protein PilT